MVKTCTSILCILAIFAGWATANLAPRPHDNQELYDQRLPAKLVLVGDEKGVVWYNQDDSGDWWWFSIHGSPNMVSDQKYIWPATDGDPNAIIFTDGSGVLAFGAGGDVNNVFVLDPDPNWADPNGLYFNFEEGSIIFAAPDGTLTEDNDNLYFDDVNDFAGFALGHIAADTRPNNFIQVYKLLNFDPDLFNTSIDWSYTDSLTGPNNVRVGYYAGKGMTSGTRNAYGGRSNGEFANENTDNAFWGYQAGQNITGTPGGGTWREWVIGRGATGIETWTYDYTFEDEVTNPPYNFTYHVHQDTAGFIYASSGKDGTDTAKPYKFNSDLTQVAGWPAYGTWPTGLGDKTVFSVRPTNDAQNVYVIAREGLTGSIVQVTKLTASAGNLVWRKEFSGLTPWDVGVLANDNVVVGNYAFSAPDRLPAILSATDGSLVLQYTTLASNYAHYRILVVEELGQWFTVGIAGTYQGLCQGYLDDSDSGWDFDPFSGVGAARGMVYKDGYLYVGTDRRTYDGNLRSIFKIDPSDGSYVDSWDLGFAPQDIAINYLGQFVAVVTSGNPMWYVYDNDFNLLESHNRNSATSWRIEQIPDPILYGGVEPGEGNRNTAIGSEALRGASGADPNEAAAGGYKSMYNVGTDSHRSTGWGPYSLGQLTSGNDDVALGPYAGWPITTEDDYLVLDSRLRASIAAMESAAIIVGHTADAPADQWLNINAKLTVDQALFLSERAAAMADVAADGQVWVKDDAPNTLYFTDDAGNDTQITASGGGLAAGTASADTEVLYDNAGVIDGDSSLTWDDGAAKALTIAGASVVGLDSAVFQPTTDSTTFFQVKNAAGTAFLVGDSTNSRLAINRATATQPLHVEGSAIFENGSILYYKDSIAANTAIFDMTISGVGGFQFQRRNAAADTRFFIVNLTGTAMSSIDFETGGGTFGTANTLTAGTVLHATGRVGFGTRNSIVPLQIESNLNAFTDTDEPENYHLLLRNPQSDLNEGVGIAFLINNETNTVGSAIIHKRTGNNDYGELQFYTKQSTAGAGPITLGLTISGDGSFTFSTAADTDLIFNFAGTTNSGVQTWMEDEDYFDFADTVKTSAGRIINRTSVTSTPYTILATDEHISVTTVSVAITLDLPAIIDGALYHIKDQDGNASGKNITVSPNGAQTIEQAASLTIRNDFASVTLIGNSTTSNWEIQ